MRAGGMCGLIGVQCRERSLLDLRDGLRLMVCSAVFDVREVVHVGCMSERLRSISDAEMTLEW